MVQHGGGIWKDLEKQKQDHLQKLREVLGIIRKSLDDWTAHLHQEVFNLKHNWLLLPSSVFDKSYSSQAERTKCL